MRISEERFAVTSFTKRAGAYRLDRLNLVPIGDCLKVGEGLQSSFGGSRVQPAGLKHIVPEADGLTVLFDDSISLWLINDGYLKLHRVATNVDNRKVIRHGRFLSRNGRIVELKNVTTRLSFRK